MANIYVGNLNFKTTQESLEAAFGQYGQVDRVNLITDRETGRPRGFAFVEMANDDEAKRAIEELNGKDLEGRTLTVNEARPRQERGGGGGGGGGRGGYGGGRGGHGGGGGGRDRDRW
ncbi:MAG: RNA-binding protein [Planctomycetes bacterium]|nr:RNA-binding protein [Planctomycetota bacterium]